MARLQTFTLFAHLVTTTCCSLFASSVKEPLEDTTLALMAASKGVDPNVLSAAEALPLDERLTFLQKAPRDESWIYEVLGLDKDLDTHLLTHQMRRLLGQDRTRAESYLLQMVLSADTDTKKRVATFLWTQTQNPVLGTCPRYKDLGIIDSSHLMRQVQHMKGLVMPSGITPPMLTPKL